MSAQFTFINPATTSPTQVYFTGNPIAIEVHKLVSADKILCRCKLGGTLFYEAILTPNTAGNATFYLQDILQTKLGFEAITNFNVFFHQETIKTFTFEFLTKTGATITGDPADILTMQVSRGMLDRLTFINTPDQMQRDGVGKWTILNNYPDNYKLASKELITLSFKCVDIAPVLVRVMYKMYYTGGGDDINQITSISGIGGPIVTTSTSFDWNDFPTATKVEIFVRREDTMAKISNTLTFIPNRANYPYQQQFVYLNALGGYSSLITTGKQSVKDAVSESVVETFLPYNAPLTQASSTVYGVEQKSEFTVETGFKTPDYIRRIRDFFASPQRFLIYDGNILPIRLKNESREFPKDGANIDSIKFTYMLDFDNKGYTQVI